MSRPKIVVFSKLFWPEGGGAELATYLIVENTLSKYLDVVVVSGTQKPVVDALRCCKYIYWPILRTKYKLIEWLKIFVSTRAIKRLIEQADIVYIPSHTLLPLAIVIKMIRPDCRIILHLHNYQALTYTSVILMSREPDLAQDLIVELSEHNSLLRAITAGVLRGFNRINVVALYNADAIVCVSNRQLEILSTYLPFVKEKAFIIYNPPPRIYVKAKIYHNPPILVYMGGESFIKGFHILINALPKLIKRNIRLVICGKINPRFKLVLSNRVEVLGKVPYERLINVYERAWGLLFPSIAEEPLPYAVIEACMTYTIPIAASVGGIPELLNGTPAKDFIFNSSDLEDMIAKIDMLLAHDKRELLEVADQVRRIIYLRLNRSSKRLINIIRNLTG